MTDIQIWLESTKVLSHTDMGNIIITEEYLKLNNKSLSELDDHDIKNIMFIRQNLKYIEEVKV